MEKPLLAQVVQDELNKRGLSPEKAAPDLGIHHNTIRNMMAYGRAEPENWRKFADWSGIKIEYLFYLAGWFPEWENLGDEPTRNLSEEEARLLEMFRNTDRRGQESILAVGQAMRLSDAAA